MTEAPLIYLIAGEPSGDLLGARLMAALREQVGGQVRFAGVGGEEMAEQGLRSLFPLSDVAVMGLLEVLPKASRILRRVRETVADVERLRPAAVVTIDSWGFTGRVAKRLKAAGSRTPRIHYVAPMVWAWRPGRARQLARAAERLGALVVRGRAEKYDAFAAADVALAASGTGALELALAGLPAVITYK